MAAEEKCDAVSDSSGHRAMHSDQGQMCNSNEEQIDYAYAEGQFTSR